MDSFKKDDEASEKKLDGKPQVPNLLEHKDKFSELHKKLNLLQNFMENLEME